MFDRNLPYNDLPLLPPAAALDANVAVLQALVEAATSLSYLNGILGQLPDPLVLVNNFALREAQASAAIENIYSTDDELYRGAAAGAGGVMQPAVKATLRYRQALFFAQAQIAKGAALDAAFMQAVGSQLMSDLGGLRGFQVNTHIRAEGREGAVYTPPRGQNIGGHHQLLTRYLDNIGAYIETGPGFALLRVLTAHYQFEAVHPFRDGNGRTGRILMVAGLLKTRLLKTPALYISQYILDHKLEYYDLLLRVTTQRKWEDWVLFLLKGIAQTAHQASRHTQAITEAMAQTRQCWQSADPRKFDEELLKIIYLQPHCRVGQVAEQRRIARPTATRYLDALTQLGILEADTASRGLFRNLALLAALQADR